MPASEKAKKRKHLIQSFGEYFHNFHPRKRRSKYNNIATFMMKGGGGGRMIKDQKGNLIEPGSRPRKEQ